MSEWHFKETELYQEEHELKVRDEEAQKIVDKIARHFKLGKYWKVKFRGLGDGGHIWCNGLIILSHNPSMALICHELAHPLCWKKYNHRHISHNNKKWAYQLSRIIEYSRKKNFWKEEIQKWRTPKELKPEPTKDELKEKLILLLENNCKRYRMKIKLYSRKLEKATKKIFRLRKR